MVLRYKFPVKIKAKDFFTTTITNVEITNLIIIDEFVIYCIRTEDGNKFRKGFSY